MRSDNINGSRAAWARGFMAFFAIVLAMGLALAASRAEAAPFAYVTNENSNNVSVTHTATNTVVKTIPVGTSPAAVAVTPDGTHVYVANFIDGTVSVIHRPGNTVVKTIPVGNFFPVGVAVTPDGTDVYVAISGPFSSGTVSVIARPGNCPASAPMRQIGRVEEGSDCLAGQAEICCHERLSRNIALRMVMSLRATATRAMSFGFPAATSLSRKLLSCGL
jgi:YVTN family beta-propeller protein